MAVLEGMGPSDRVVFELSKDRMTIGRKDENDITINWDQAVSRRHAEVELVSGCWFVTDLDSANGTFVNGAKVEQKRALHVGDELRVGDTCLWLHGMTSSEPVSTTSPAVKAPDLSPKQREVLRELCRPQVKDPRSPCSTTKDIAARMFVGEAAVKAHLSSLYVKFDIPEVGQQRRALLAKKAWDSGAVRASDFEADDRDG
jgi:pSer/pThr/pTyr-binding forkhead associated (FHA) protein